MADRMHRLARAIEKLNPGVSVVMGGQHQKIMRNGEILAVLPTSEHYGDGLSHNLRNQLKRAGVVLP